MKQPQVLQAGTEAPTWSLPSNTGKKIGLADYAGKQIVILYFYPKADTPGCTKEACGFRDAAAEYRKGHVAVLGISPDSVEAIDKFGAKYQLNFPLLADSDHRVAEAYGVWQEKTNYGKTYMGIVRTTFVIGKNGVILHVFQKVKPEGHDEEVLQWLKENDLLAAG